MGATPNLNGTEDSQGTFKQTQWKEFCNSPKSLRSSPEGLVDHLAFPPKDYFNLPVHDHSNTKMIDTANYAHNILGVSGGPPLPDTLIWFLSHGPAYVPSRNPRTLWVLIHREM